MTKISFFKHKNNAKQIVTNNTKPIKTLQYLNCMYNIIYIYNIIIL